MSQTNQDNYSHDVHDSHDDHAHDHDHDHDHEAVDPGEVIAEKSAQDRMLISVCAIAMTLLMICMGTWMQIPTPSGGGHNEHEEHSKASEQAQHAPESHETQSH